MMSTKNRNNELHSVNLKISGMSCAGCYIAPFHTVADSAREHHMGIEPLLVDLNQALEEALA